MSALNPCNPWNPCLIYIFSSFASSILPSPKGANVNNRRWNDRREWNLRIMTDSLLSSPKGANRSKTGCDSPPSGTLSPSCWLSAGSMTFGHSTSGYWKLAPFGDRRLLAKLESIYCLCGRKQGLNGLKWGLEMQKKGIKEPKKGLKCIQKG